MRLLEFIVSSNQYEGDRSGSTCDNLENENPENGEPRKLLLFNPSIGMAGDDIGWD